MIAKSKELKMMKIYTLITLVIFLVIGEISFSIYCNAKDRNSKEAMLSVANSYAQRIQESLLRKVYIPDIMEGMLRLTEYDMDQFGAWAHTVVASESGIGSIQLAPNGIVRYIYPLRGNEGAIGHDLLKDKKRDAGARKTIENQKATLVGPLKLIQNNKEAIIIRKPIFNYIDGEKGFWGFAIVVVYLDDIIFPELKDMESKGYAYTIVGDDPDSIKSPKVIDTSQNLTKWEAEYPIIVPGDKWIFKISRTEKAKYLMEHVGIIFICLIFFFAYTFQHYKVIRKTFEVERLNDQLKELSYMDELTKFKNRRGIHIELANLLDEKELELTNIVIAMIDIDYFKKINDTYGHKIGDLALQHVSVIFRSLMSKEHLMGRLGGDEFVCAFEGYKTEDITMFFDRMLKKLETYPLEYMGQKIRITLSVGISIAKNGETIDEIIEKADKALYVAKRNGRNQVCVYSKE